VVEHIQVGNTREEILIARLGADLLDAQTPQLVVRAGSWQGARLAAPDDSNAKPATRRGWALMSCTMSPAWDEREFTLGDRAGLLKEFPYAAHWIQALTRDA